MNEGVTKNNNKQFNKKKWLILGVIGSALLLIPRRSSRQIVPCADGLNKDSNGTKKGSNER